MAGLILSVSALLTGIALLVSGNTLLTSLLGVRLGLDGVATDTIGWVMGAYALGFVLGSLHSHRVIDRVGHIRAFAVFAGLACITALLHPLLVHPLAWALLRLLSGLCVAGVLLVIESWLSTRASNANRATLFAGYQMCFYLSAAGGQLLLATGDPLTFRPFNLAGMLLVAALVPLALTRLPAPAIEPAARLPLRRLFHIAPLGPVTCLASGLLISGFSNLGPVYATLTGLSLEQTARFMAVSVLAAMLFAWPLGRLSDRIDRRRMLLWMSLAAAVASLACALLGRAHPGLLLLTAAAFMGVTAALYPVAVALINDRLPLAQIMPASASLLLAYGLGSCLGPVLGAQLMALLGPAGLFWGLGLVLALLALFAAANQHSGRDVTVEAQEAFVTTLAETAPVLAELSPYPEVADYQAAELPSAEASGSEKQGL